jgi:hypothetical protein
MIKSSGGWDWRSPSNFLPGDPHDVQAVHGALDAEGQRLLSLLHLRQDLAGNAQKGPLANRITIK